MSQTEKDGFMSVFLELVNDMTQDGPSRFPFHVDVENTSAEVVEKSKRMFKAICLCGVRRQSYYYDRIENEVRIDFFCGVYNGVVRSRRPDPELSFVVHIVAKCVMNLINAIKKHPDIPSLFKVPEGMNLQPFRMSLNEFKRFLAYSYMCLFDIGLDVIKQVKTASVLTLNRIFVAQCVEGRSRLEQAQANRLSKESDLETERLGLTTMLRFPPEPRFIEWANELNDGGDWYELDLLAKE